MENNEYIQEEQPVEETVQEETQTAPENKPEMVTISKNEFFKLQRLAAKKTQKPEQLSPEKSQPGFDPDALIDNFALVKEFTPDELANIRKEAKDLGVDTFKFIQSNAGKTFVDKVRSEKKAQDSTLAPSTRGVVFNGKPVNQVFTDASASASDKQAAFEARIRGNRSSSNL